MGKSRSLQGLLKPGKHSNKYLGRKSPWPFSSFCWAQGSSLHQVWPLFPDWSYSPCWPTYIQLFRTQLSAARTSSCPINVGFRTQAALKFNRGGRDGLSSGPSVGKSPQRQRYLRPLWTGSSLEPDYRTWWTLPHTPRLHTPTADRNLVPRPFLAYRH